MNDPNSNIVVSLKTTRAIWGLWFLGLASALVGFHQWVHWPLGASGSSSAVVIIVFALALMNTKSQVAALLFIPCLAQTALLIVMADGKGNLSAGESLGPLVALGTVGMSLLFVLLVSYMERQADQ